LIDLGPSLLEGLKKMFALARVVLKGSLNLHEIHFEDSDPTSINQGATISTTIPEYILSSITAQRIKR